VKGLEGVGAGCLRKKCENIRRKNALGEVDPPFAHRESQKIGGFPLGDE